MRFAFFFLLAACTSSTPHPDPCPDCNPAQCPDPSQVVPNATCSVVPLVCPSQCNKKCQCWPDDAGANIWVSTTECEGGATDATADASDAGDAD
jgi:hypothetical protein